MLDRGTGEYARRQSGGAVRHLVEMRHQQVITRQRIPGAGGSTSSAAVTVAHLCAVDDALIDHSFEPTQPHRSPRRPARHL